MDKKTVVHLSVMFVLSLILGYVVFGIISPPDIGAAYGIGFVLGKGVSSILVPLLLVSIPAVLYKRVKKTQMPGYLPALWGIWVSFSALATYNNLTLS